MAKAQDTEQTETVSTPIEATVHWNDGKMATTFANVVNVLATREEFALLFGTNQTWNAGELREFTVELHNRIVLTPHATKRLLLLLQARMNEYEQRFGAMSLS